MVLGIVGAGASGMAAALSAAENPNVEIIIFERQSRVGRKLQATGNGRCNLTNLNAKCGGYHGNDPHFAQYALNRFDPQATLNWFQELGLFTVAEQSGRVYPYSDQANSVVDILRFALNKPNIQLRLGAEVERIACNNDVFRVTTAAGEALCDKVIVACGGLAGTKLGGTMSGYKLLGKLGHKSSKLRPSLVQLKCAWSGVVALKGVRANCRVQILHNSNLFAESLGEIQFTEYGLSGPVIFEVSRDVCYGAGEWLARLDFLPHISKHELLSMLTKRRDSNIPTEDFLTGILHNRLGKTLLKAVGVNAAHALSSLNDSDIEAVAATVKCFDIVLDSPMGMESAQVTAGGILTKDIDASTMESRLIPGLYVCGEVLDVDGDCGGYNLQWAWSSGRTAGLHAGGMLE